MGNYKNKAYPLRIDNDLMQKMKKIAEKEDRPLNRQIERIVKEFVKKYEDQHGEIEI